jgi:hypothetical protein
VISRIVLKLTKLSSQNDRIAEYPPQATAAV